MRSSRSHPGRLGDIAEMELWLGPFPHLPPAFDSDEQRRELWFRHRDRLMEQFGAHGRRPQAWWRYEAGELRYPGYIASARRCTGPACSPRRSAPSC